MSATDTIRLPGTPKPWQNAAMRTLLRAPGLRQLMGKTFAVITVTGSKTGTRYSTPVQYVTIDGHYVVLSQTMRRWWRNIRTQPQVDLEIAGDVISGHATIAEGDRARDLLTQCLAKDRRTAKFYGFRRDQPIDEQTNLLDQLQERLVVIDIDPDA